MNLKDLVIPYGVVASKKWQLGSIVCSSEIPENGVVMLFVSEYRGANFAGNNFGFERVRQQLYQFSKLDFEGDICDLGLLVSGKTLNDTHVILQEILSFCFYKNTLPIIVGGSQDLAYSLFRALNFHQKNIRYTHISNVLSLSHSGSEITEDNFLHKIFSAKNFSLKDFCFLGYQNFLNEKDSVNLIEEMGFEMIRLTEMMHRVDRVEPFLRKTDLVTLNCDAVESFSDAFSIHPQVNGLNRREICAYMKEVGLGEELKCFGLFNFNPASSSLLNHQLLAQMLWHLLEGISIQKTHPKERDYETYLVPVDKNHLAFRRDTFRNLWYFGDQEDISSCIPCSREDFDLAKKGILSRRLLRKIS
ncbi:MAG: arginase [Bergeyella sp.]|nr:arginase [Bergeyella sp.]